LKVKLKLATANGGELLLSYTAIPEGNGIKFTYHSEDGRPPIFGPAAQERPSAGSGSVLRRVVYTSEPLNGIPQSSSHSTALLTVENWKTLKTSKGELC
jgi:hypothetical protein